MEWPSRWTVLPGTIAHQPQPASNGALFCEAGNEVREWYPVGFNFVATSILGGLHHEYRLEKLAS